MIEDTTVLNLFFIIANKGDCRKGITCIKCVLYEECRIFIDRPEISNKGITPAVLKQRYVSAVNYINTNYTPEELFEILL